MTAMTLDQIVKALQGHRIEVVAAETGLHYNTVRKYAEGRAIDPPASTIRKLEDYLSDNGTPVTEAEVFGDGS